MSKMTTRLSDSQLADIAKQKYETHQINRVPGTIVELPSRGMVYPTSSLLRSGTVEMRYMTAYDEDILTNASYIKQGIMLDKLLESLILTPGFKIKDLAVADKEWLVISARISSYGSTYDVQITDPTGKLLSTSVELSKLQFKPFDLKSDANGEFDYITESGDKLKYKYPTNFVMNNLPEDRVISFLLENCITQVNDTRLPAEITEYLKYNMRSIESRKFRAHIADTTPGIDMTYEFEYVTKEGNKETFRAGFPIGSDFLWI
jgi:hypothetical protein